jgi:hypothetical protein
MRSERVRKMGKWMYDIMSDRVNERQDEKVNKRDEWVNE